MKRLTNVLSTALIAAGLALLAYVGISYLQPKPSAASPHWSPRQVSEAHHLVAQLNHHQTLVVPKKSYRYVAAPGSEPALRMIIPKIAVDAPVVQTAPVSGVWEVADWAIGHLTTTPSPGARGNAAYSAHDDIKGEIFKRVGELSPGDTIKLVTAHSVYTYVVTNLRTVDPSDVSVLDPTSASTVTLISCAPYWVDTQRLAIQGVLKSSAPR